MNERAPLGFRTLPHNIEAEQALLGAILINNAAFTEVSGYVEPGHFYEPVHGRIFAAMQRHITAGRLADHVLLRAEFDQDEALPDLNGGQYLAGLARAAESIVNAGDYGRMIHDLAVKRGLINVGEELVNKAYDPSLPESGAEQIAAARTNIEALAREATPLKRAEPLPSFYWTLDDIGKLEPPRWIIEGLLPRRAKALIFGESGHYKTMHAVDMFCLWHRSRRGRHTGRRSPSPCARQPRTMPEFGSRASGRCGSTRAHRGRRVGGLGQSAGSAPFGRGRPRQTPPVPRVQAVAARR